MLVMTINKKGDYRIFLLMIMTIAIISMLSISVSAFEFDNVKTYDTADKTVTVKNSFGFGDTLFKGELTTPQSYPTVMGKDRLVGEINITTLDTSLTFKEIFNDMYFVNMKTGEQMAKDYRYKIKVLDGVREIPITELECGEIIKGEKEPTDCPIKITGYIYEDIYSWKEIKDVSDIPKGEFTLGIFTDVEPNEYGDWVIKVYGQTVPEWATWNDTFQTNLKAVWNFEETSGTNAADALDGNNNGTINAGVTLNQEGKFNKAFNFSASTNSNKVLVADHVDLRGSSITVNAWVRPSETFGNNRGIVAKGGDTAGGYYIRGSGANVQCGGRFSGGGGFSGSGGAGWIANNYTMITGVFDTSAGTCTVYVNGVAVATSGSGALANDVTSALYIGADDWATTEAWNGTIDEVYLWKEAKGTSFISSLYSSYNGTFFGNNVTVGDNEYPQFYNSSFTPANGTQFFNMTAFQFMTNINNTNGTTFLGFGNTNYSLANLSTTFFNVTLKGLSAGTYSYYFGAYGNGSSHNFNKTQTLQYTISKNVTTMKLYIDGNNGDTVKAINTLVWLNGTLINGDYDDGINLTVGGVQQNFSLTSPVIFQYNTASPPRTVVVNATYVGDANYTSSTESWNLIISNTLDIPVMSNFRSNPTAPVQYSPSQSYLFNVTVTDSANNQQAVIFELNNINYTASNSTSTEFFVTIPPLPANTYTYRWFANDTVGGSNTSLGINYNITRFSTTCTLNNNTITSYPQTVFVNGTCNNLESTNNLYRQNISISNNYSAILAAQSWTFVLNTSQTQNYTSANATVSITIPQNNTYALSINSNPATTVTYPTTTTITGNGCPTDGAVSGISCSLFRDGILKANPEALILGAGTYNYTFNSSINQNYSYKAASQIITVNKATGSVATYINGSRSNVNLMNGSVITINGNLTSGQFGTLNLTVNGTQVATSNSANLTYTYQFNDTGTYTILTQYYGNANYTGANESFLLTVTSGATGGNVSLVYPTNGLVLSNGNITFNWTITNPNLNFIENTTAYIWNADGTLNQKLFNSNLGRNINGTVLLNASTQVSLSAVNHTFGFEFIPYANITITNFTLGSPNSVPLEILIRNSSRAVIARNNTPTNLYYGDINANLSAGQRYYIEGNESQGGTILMQANTGVPFNTLLYGGYINITNTSDGGYAGAFGNTTIFSLTGFSFTVTGGGSRASQINLSYFNNTLTEGFYNFSADAAFSQGDTFSYALSNNNTFSITPILNASFNLSSFETATESFILDYNLPNDIVSSTAILYYDGTAHTSTVSCVGQLCMAINRMDLPLNNVATVENNSFYWDIALTNTTATRHFNSALYNQTVTAIRFAICNTTNSVAYINFTFKDEQSNANINASIDSSTWQYYLGNAQVNRTLNYANATEWSDFAFCFTPSYKTLHTDFRFQYSGASYPSRTFATFTNLTNSTTTQVLYLLNSADGIYVTFQTITSANSIIPGVTVIAQRDFSGVPTTVAQGTTDGSGAVTFWLNPNVEHQLFFSKSGCTSSTFSVVPSQSSYTVTLQCEGQDSFDTSPIQGIIFQKYPTSGPLSTGFTTFNYSVFSVDSNVSITKAKFELIYSNGTVIKTNETLVSSNLSFCTASQCNLSLTYTVQKSDDLKGRYYVDVGDGYILLEGDAHWRAITPSPTRTTNIKYAFRDLKSIFSEWTAPTCSYSNDGLQGTGCTIDQLELQNKLEYSRLVFFFLALAIVLSVLGKLTGYDGANPGIFIWIVGGLIIILSLVGGVDGEGFFYYSNLTPFHFLNNYILAFTMLMVMIGYYCMLSRRQT